MKHKNPFLGVMLFNILVLIGMIISAINCIVISIPHVEIRRKITRHKNMNTV
jgi:hypothetical protein